MTDDNQSIMVIVTGGTIDALTTGQDRDELPPVSSVQTFLKVQYPEDNFEYVNNIFWKDSRDVNQKDRQKLLDFINGSNSHKILITHGTYTLPETARYLKQYVSKPGATIILTGAMAPMTFANSDGPENLQFCMEQLDQLRPGVYIGYRGQVIDPDNAIKDEIIGIISGIH